MTAVNKRIYVGNIFSNFDECLYDLYRRFEKFGKCEDNDFEKHDTFAFINMSFNDEPSIRKFRSTFNNINFKGNVLKVDLAKPDWKEAWEIQHKQDAIDGVKIEKAQAKKDWEFYKKIENINMSWEARRKTIPGRMRNTPRPRQQLRNVTFRVNVNGSLKVYKCYKNKLWGYERNKDIKDLVSKFSGNKWWNNYNHIVDKLDYSRSKQTVHFRSENNKLLTITHNEEQVDESEEEHLTEAEKAKNTDILANILNEYNFDEPVNVVDSDEAEEFGFNQEDEEPQEESQYSKQYNNDSGQFHQSDNYGDEQYEQEQYTEEPSTTNKRNKKQPENNTGDNKVEEEEEEEEEFMPKFPATVAKGTISNTETLRSLFNPEQPDTSKLQLIPENEDIDETQNTNDTAALPIDTESYIEPIVSKGPVNHLFFPHFNSPFLVGQTQLVKVKHSLEKDVLEKWDDEFWENRGAWMKEMKNRKRDALRQLRKKKAKDGNKLLI